MVSKKTFVATGAVATFGAAMTSMYLTPDLLADVVDITWNGGNASASAPFSSGSSNLVMQDIDQVVDGPNDFRQYNDQFGGDGVGRSMFVCQSGELDDIVLVSSGQVIDPATFGTATSFCNIGAGTVTTFVGTGSALVGFRSASGNVGWYRVNFVDQGPITYTDGQYGSMGESVTAGDMGGGCNFAPGDVNNDGMVSLLDVSAFVTAVTGGPGAYVCEADFDQDGDVDLLDVAPFVAALTGG